MEQAKTLQFLVVAALCAVVLVTAITRARKQQLNIRYAAGWITLAITGIAASFLLSLVSPVASALGVTPGVVVFAAATLVLIALTMQLSISLSGALTQTELLALHHALSGNPEPDTLPDQGVLVIVPAWNEEHNVGQVVENLRRFGYGVLVVDDGSSDGTARVARQAGALVISLPFNLGVGAAIRCGLRYAHQNGFSRVVQCDADGQHPTESIEELLRVADDSGADVVIGSRFMNGRAVKMQLPFSRRLAMRVLAVITSRATGNDISDSTSGFRVISQPLLGELAHSMPSYYLGDTFETYVAAGRSGYQVVETHTPIRERVSGTSSATVKSSILLLAKALFLTTTRLGIRLPQRPKSSE